MSGEFEDRESGLGELPGASIPDTMPAPGFKPGQDIPPDLMFKEKYAGNESAQAIASMAESGDINSRNNKELFRALRRQGYFIVQPILATTTPVSIRPFESRTYFFIQNLGTVGDILIGFGAIPNASFGLTLTPGSAYEPFTVPVNEIYISSSAGSIPGYLIYAREQE